MFFVSSIGISEFGKKLPKNAKDIKILLFLGGMVCLGFSTFLHFLTTLFLCFLGNGSGVLSIGGVKGSIGSIFFSYKGGSAGYKTAFDSVGSLLSFEAFAHDLSVFLY